MHLPVASERTSRQCRLGFYEGCANHASALAPATRSVTSQACRNKPCLLPTGWGASGLQLRSKALLRAALTQCSFLFRSEAACRGRSQAQHLGRLVLSVHGSKLWKCRPHTPLSLLDPPTRTDSGLVMLGAQRCFIFVTALESRACARTLKAVWVKTVSGPGWLAWPGRRQSFV